MKRILRRLFIPVIIKDVAILAGVSPSTVSRTYRDHPSISRQTKEKVRRAMAKLNYEPNFQANSLVVQNSRTMGITPPSLGWEAYQNPFYLETIRGISQYCSRRQYINTMIMGQNEGEVLQTIKTTARAGLAEEFIVLYSREQDSALDYFYEEGLLYVLMGKACRNVDQTIYADSSSMLAGRGAAEYLLNLGHVRIAYLSGDRFLLYNHDRKTEYMLVLIERGIPLDGQLCVEMFSMSEGQDQVLEALFTREDRPTAALVSDDMLAVVLERTCIGLGLFIPGGVSILSFNNFLLSKLILPPLTSVDVNAYQLGIEATAQMISHVGNPGLVATKIIAPHHLVGRGSCVGTGRLCDDWDTETI